MPAGLPALLQSFFTDRLCRQRRASPNTISGYRDSFRLLFHFAKERLGKTPSKLMIEDLNVSFIGDFLDHLEKQRKNSARTRNIRLAAIHSFFQYVAFEEPAHALLCQRVLAMPAKRTSGGPSNFSIAKRWTPSWRQPTFPPGSGAATGRCFCSPFRRASGSPS